MMGYWRFKGVRNARRVWATCRSGQLTCGQLVKTSLLSKNGKKTTSVGEDVEKVEPSYAAGRMKSGAAAAEKSLAVPQRVTHRVTM